MPRRTWLATLLIASGLYFFGLYSRTTEREHGLMAAEQGDFSGRLEQRSSDEIGRISEQTNRLMATLEESFGTIVNDVEPVGDHPRLGSVSVPAPVTPASDYCGKDPRASSTSSNTSNTEMIWTTPMTL